ncbi:rod shape-determining protein MreC [Latilactobacillus sakei]|uniref:rod shape-determining protein MreC n=1 Tax=Latilactobacillus sakei TaxID=1599 RepID=UPI000DC6476B|nr:rod shape-determining protein MreC [Latilactobacillus sakei]MCP8852368.1 rod shape-determining protein MreC [Latilactobacillus sakei]SPS03942.1 Cell shape-determining protein MreC precursor [Latilactobacillus sakei]
MQKFFSNKKLIILLVTLIVCMGFIAMSVGLRNSKKSPSFIRQFGNDVTGITNQVVSVPANGIGKGVDALTDLINTYQENKALKAQLDDLAQTKVQAQTLKEENKNLKKELNLAGTLTDYTTLNASVLSRNPDNWQNSLVINKGSLAGLKKNMPVMSESGIIGRISEVNKTNAKVELVSSTGRNSNGFAAVVNTKDGKQVNGIMTGYNSDKKQLKLGQIKTDTAIAKGDKVVTSGLGGLTPKGLYLGKVASVKKDDYGLALTVYVTPAADLNNLTVVTVIKRSIEGE